METVQTLEPGDFTLADLDALPDDGKQYELVDGMLMMTPSPIPLHQRAVSQLFRCLDRNLPPDEFELFFAPLDYRPTDRRSLQPDLMLVRRVDVGLTHITKPPLLVIEVLSRATRSKDLVLKRSLYEEAGVPSYWLFDPIGEELTVLELDNGVYVERATVKGEDAFETTTPYDVRIIPAEMVR
ncbi:Uma2 family endonuclease [Kribbella deserti]|uniref:Uma2 family endonuclease n=1 Tax=Kribbella deserti TaxID=1926257 RepID=A0ABV6QWP8_9ACTN